MMRTIEECIEQRGEMGWTELWPSKEELELWAAGERGLFTQLGTALLDVERYRKSAEGLEAERDELTEKLRALTTEWSMIKDRDSEFMAGESNGINYCASILAGLLPRVAKREGGGE